MRILGFILILTLGCANLVSTNDNLISSMFPQESIFQTIQRRLPPVKVRGGLFNLAAFKNMAFTIWCTAGFITFLGLYTCRYLRVDVLKHTLTSFIFDRLNIY
jgi:hypothetical protein